MNILALDLGTDCGFAIFKDGKFISGTKKLGTYKEKFGERFYEFRKWLLNVIAKHNIEAVYFERSTDTKALKPDIVTAVLCIPLHLSVISKTFHA